ncbi:MAG: class I SAM-dependent methyltransferase [Anaerolineales bacterium]|jgi:ubiquinone/menaquinone biosynthesis C-methylase UbiE
MSGKADYGNWLPKKINLAFLYTATILFIAALLVRHSVLGKILYSVSALALIFFLYLTYAYHLLGKDDGELQKKFYLLVIDKLGWDGNGRVLDIGTGNGALAIELAKRFLSSEVTGVDLWGKPWSYSQESCEDNAALEGVAERVRFIRTSAEDLTFDEETFDAVVSNFVFHVVETTDRMSLLKEALRVLKKGGTFSFQDLFNSEFYDDSDNLADELRSWGVEEVRFVESSDYIKIPLVLRTNHIVGNSGVLFGKK